MTQFTYKAVRGNGEHFSGTIEASDRFDVYAQVRKEGATVLSVSEAGKRMFSMDALNARISRIKESEKIVLTRNLSAMLAAGLPLSRALSVAERQSKNQKLRGVLHSVAEDLQRGLEFSASLTKHTKVFSPLMVAMVKAGEESGTLGATLGTIAEQNDRSYQLKKKIHGALIYPTIVVIALVIVGILMLIFIVPTLTATFTELGVELPASTQMIISTSQFLTEHTIVALLIIVAVVAGFISLARTTSGKRILDTVFLRLPIIGGLVRETNAARTGRTLSALLSSGVNVMQSIDITAEVLQNGKYKAVMVEAREAVTRGEPMSRVLEKHGNLYPALVCELVAVGEETGKLPDMLLEVAKFYENEVEQKTKNMSTIVEPVLMLLVGGVVGFFAVSMITPIYSITSNI